MKRWALCGIIVSVGVLLGFKMPAFAYSPQKAEEVTMEVVDNREYSDLVIAQVDNYVNIRDLPDVSKGKILGKLYNNSVGYLEEEVDGWYKITSGTVTGYVSAEYCVCGNEALKIARDVETTIATITASKLRIREEANTESDILGTFSKGDELVVLSEEDGFARITYNNKSGYISLEYCELHTEFVQAESIEEERARLEAERKAKEAAKKAAAAALAAEKAKEEAAAVVAASGGDASDLGQQVVDYAVQFVGNPYVYGGTSLTNGCDCSGFVMSVYAHFGVKLPRTGQRNSGYAISSLSDALPGDILCYSGHVAIYMGGGRIVHAATPEQGIVIGDASYTTIIGIRRIF